MSVSSNKKRAGNTASLIYDALRADILSGVLQPGAPLSQPRIAKAHGVSRGPVREALRRLQQDQLVIARANQRFSVVPHEIADLEAVLGLFLVNVTMAARISVPLLADEDIDALEEAIVGMERAEEARNLEDWDAAYRQFTLMLVHNAGTRTVDLIGHLMDNIQRYRQTTLSKVPRVYAGGPEFREFMDAIVSRDGPLAAMRISDFTGRMATLILAGLAPHYDAFRLRGYIMAFTSGDR